MNKKTLQAALKDLPLGGLRYFEEIGSTNDIALRWVEEGGADFSLVAANAQSAGRGRNNRRWLTPPDSALAFSLLLRPSKTETKHISLFTGLGAVALRHVLQKKYALNAQIKWPNDILLAGKKTAGILVESSWLGDKLQGIVLGIGINVHAAAVPKAETLNFPATSLQDALGNPPRRTELLREILLAVQKRRPLLGSGDLVAAWEENLAFRGKQVQITRGDGRVIRGKILGINPDGSLRLDSLQSLHFGDVHLRPMRVSYTKVSKEVNNAR
jgi:BirA family biotin operon repressor/biotin-[acetyl-CoA-carboxylase] ligase